MTWPATLFPEARDRLHELEAELWAPGRLDPTILERCRARVAMLLGDDSVEQPQWPRTDELDARTRACLAFAEQYVLDAHGVTDELCASLRAELTDAEAVALTMAVATFDATSRARIVLR